MKAFALAALLTATVYLPMVSGSSGGSAVLPTLTPVGTSTIVRTPEATPTQTPTPTATQVPTDSATPAATGTSQPTSTPDMAATPTPTRPVSSTAVRRINAPHFTGGAGVEQAAVAWFGQVDSTSNYADVRVFFTDAFVKVHLHIFDRRLWYDTSPAAMELEAFDAVSLYLDSATGGDAPSATSHRFVAQLNHWEDRSGYQAAYRGDGQDWVPAGTQFTTGSGWRGDGLNNGAEARGWAASFEIPFASLGLTGPPPAHEVWKMALALHDRDDGAGTSIPVQTWPEQLDGQRPSSWGELAFGIPSYDPPATANRGVTQVRQGLDNATVIDGHVGGHTTCGEDFQPDYFEGWGDANYAGYEQVNIQNQWDVADWPCFSKYFVTFPLDRLPDGKAVVSATLTMHLFGNSGQGETPAPQPSLIQVLTVAEDWDEAAITWNNAPLALENVSSAWVDPVGAFPGWPGVPYAWDVGRAVAAAYARGGPLRLALYSADTEQHSGKYFTGSDTEDWNAQARPSLSVTWGEPVSLAQP